MGILEKIKETGSTSFPLSEVDDMEGSIVVDGYAEDPYYNALEKRIAELAIKHAHYNEENRETYPKDFLDGLIDQYEATEGGKIKLDIWQREAVYAAINNNLFVLTGGPGTGKTCVLKCIHFVLKTLKGRNDVKFTAPTGKAARRITESTGEPACTLHKKMKLYNELCEPDIIWADALIVDEISMLDTWTAAQLFKAITDDTKLILVGDVEQLPSVGPGSVLRDLIDAGLPCVKLEKTFRQASESGLFANIIEVKEGLHFGFVEREDFVVLRPRKGEEKQVMIDAFLKEVSEWGLENVVCLTPYRRKGETCAIKMNEELQKVLNPKKKGCFIEKDIVEEDGFQYHVSFRVGDPVMQLENTNTVANGDVGVIREINGLNLTVQFIDCAVKYKFDELGQLALAYAMSVHKSQGSEYKSVITSALPSEMGMLSRNTIYTGITRAKQKCTVVTDDKTAKEACKIEAGYERTTGLVNKIRRAEKDYKFLKALNKWEVKKCSRY